MEPNKWICSAKIGVCVFSRGRDWRSAGLTLAFHINRGSVVDPGTRQGMSHLFQTVTPFGSEVKLHRFGKVTFVSEWVQNKKSRQKYVSMN